jgi:hypothetical protein
MHAANDALINRSIGDGMANTTYRVRRLTKVDDATIAGLADLRRVAVE